MEVRKPGRPRRYDFCNDCGDDGLVPPEAGQKVYGAYCKRHHGIRQKRSRRKRFAQISTRIPVTLGYWDEVPDRFREDLVGKCDERIADLFELPQEQASSIITVHAKAFEYRCMQQAIHRKQRLTPTEEDVIIAQFGGSRDGFRLSDIPPAGLPGTTPRVPVDLGKPGGTPICMPEPTIRRMFRIEECGPTTIGEPTLAQYYEMAEKPYPEDIADHDREGLPDDDSNWPVASDGVKVNPDLMSLDEYERWLKTQDIDVPPMPTEEPPDDEWPGPPLGPPRR